MKALSKTDKAARDVLLTRLNEAYEKVDNAIAELNAVLADAREFAGAITARIEEYMNDRSENWLEGEKGQAYEEWKGEWENAEQSLDDKSFDDENPADILDALPTEVEA